LRSLRLCGEIAGWMMEMRIEVRAAGDLTEEERRQLSWPWDAPERDFEWSEPDWCVLVWADGQVVSQLAIAERTCLVAGQPVKLGGVGGVIALPDWRGRGFTSRAMRRAAAFMCQELGVEFGLLVCEEDVVAFYERLGWQVVEGPLTFDQPGGKATWPAVAMVLPCGEKAWPTGTIDLCGRPW